MKLAQLKIKWLSRLMLGLVLFAQGIVAANACIVPSASPSQAYAIEQNAGVMPCHEEEITNDNACLGHCTQTDRISVDQYNVPLAAPVSVVSWVTTRPQVQSMRPASSPEYLALNTGPPISIRFCSFLI